MAAGIPRKKETNKSMTLSYSKRGEENKTDYMFRREKPTVKQ